jgi:two-component system NtrC family sensor kinase
MVTEPVGNPYRRLRNEMLVVLLSFGLVPLLAMGAAGLAANHRAVETQMRKVLEAMVKNREATVQLFLEETMRQLELVSASSSVAQLSQPEFLERLRAQMERERGAIIDLGLIDDHGRHVVYVGPYKLQDLDYSAQSWFQQVMVLGRYESDIFLGFRQFPHMVMAVKKHEGERDYVLRATIDTDLLSALVREGGVESGADVFILNRAGEYQTRYSNEHRLMEKAEIGEVPLHSGVRVVDARRLGHHEIVATTWLREDSWVLVARQELPRFSLTTMHPAVIGLLLLGLLIIPLLSVLIARHRMQQFHGLESERVALYESVAQSQKMAAIGRLAAGIAHEINNPLAIIQAQVGVLTDALADAFGPPPAAELKARLEKIAAQVERGRKVTHRLLGFSRRVGPELEPVDVVAALQETVSFVEKELEASKVRLTRDYDPDLPIIRSSLSQMQQVFLNLINNALDAMGEGGELRLTVRRDENGILVEVGDTGPGIPARELSRIFEPFYTTKPAVREHSGLGLAICQELMRGVGGRISASSSLGVGTVFTLWFPWEVERG